MSNEPRDPKTIYGWLVVAACFAVTLTLGETFWSFGVFFKPLETEFGWDRATLSSCYTAFLIGFGVSAIVSGRLADRYKPRYILLVAALLAGLGISLCSQTHSVNQLRIFLLIAGLGAGATWPVPVSTVQRWFYGRQRAGLALSIVVAGVGVGALIFAPLINHLILSYGWRNAFLLVGIVFFIIISASALVIRPSPIATKTAVDRLKKVQKSQGGQAWPTGRIMTTPAFISIAFVFCVGMLAFNTLSVHLVPYAVDLGVSSMASAVALGLMGGFSIPGRILAGFISDRIGWQRVLALSIFGMALSLTFLLFLKAQWMLYCFVILYGFCHGSRIPPQVGIISKFFGMDSLGELLGITMAIAQLGGAVGPYITGFIFDMTGSYFVAFIIVMVFLLTGAIATLMMRSPSIASNMT